MKNEQLCSYLKDIHRGRQRLIGGRQLAAAMRVSENELRRRINGLRRRGVPIASSHEGYFYAATAGEVYATILSLRRMAAGLEAAAEGLEGSLERFCGSNDAADTDNTPDNHGAAR